MVAIIIAYFLKKLQYNLKIFFLKKLLRELFGCQLRALGSQFVS